ncbi:MAG: hypothetical protein IRZ32_07045 [Solirubrobacteraceae bacterium]|nr:hypothetical protein [Solirubrobacteraceae bacterium]
MRRPTMLAWGAAALAAAAPAAALAHGDRDHDRDRTATVGTVASFADGTLTLTLADGSTLAAAVTGRTDIDCHAAATARAARHGAGTAKGHRRGRGHRHGHRGHRGHRHARDCTAADLTVGTLVRDAIVRATTAGAVFTDVDLVKERPAG